MIDTNEKPTKLLLHACCAPCSLEPVRLIRQRGIEPCVFYANSNITPEAEYERRLSTIITWANSKKLDLVEDRYDPQTWRKTAGKIGDAAHERFGVIAGSMAEEEEAECSRQARCRACYRMRLQRSAHYAAENGFDALGTTLSVSPYQYTDIIAEELDHACKKVGIRAFFEDYRPYYDKATRLSREAGMYRQNYCGCHFSLEEAEVERDEQKRMRAALKHEKRLAHAEERAAEEASRAARRAERAAYEAKQARKHEILRNLRMQQKTDADIEQIGQHDDFNTKHDIRCNESGIKRFDRQNVSPSRERKHITHR